MMGDGGMMGGMGGMGGKKPNDTAGPPPPTQHQH
jgi:hypothetical protein